LSVVDALDCGHDEDIVHRDVKTGNTLIEKRNKRPLITDFGITGVVHGPRRNSQIIMETPIYMAPGQIVNNRADRRSNLYATGVMLFEMLASTSLLPKCQSVRELMTMKFELRDKSFGKKPSELNPAIDEKVHAIVMKALHHESDESHQSCAEFRDQLEAYVPSKFGS
jgi:serine/threonine-protein kinase